MKKFVLIFLLLFLSGCEDELLSINYIKDNRTNICFAYIYSSLSSVPCTKEVLKLIKKVN